MKRTFEELLLEDVEQNIENLEKIFKSSRSYFYVFLIITAFLQALKIYLNHLAISTVPNPVKSLTCL